MLSPAGYRKLSAGLYTVDFRVNLQIPKHQMSRTPKGLHWTITILYPWDKEGKTALIQLTRINGLPSRFRHLERHHVNTHYTLYSHGKCWGWTFPNYGQWCVIHTVHSIRIVEFNLCWRGRLSRKADWKAKVCIGNLFSPVAAEQHESGTKKKGFNAYYMWQGSIQWATNKLYTQHATTAVIPQKCMNRMTM